MSLVQAWLNNRYKEYSSRTLSGRISNLAPTIPVSRTECHTKKTHLSKSVPGSRPDLDFRSNTLPRRTLHAHLAAKGHCISFHARALQAFPRCTHITWASTARRLQDPLWHALCRTFDRAHTMRLSTGSRGRDLQGQAHCMVPHRTHML